MLPSIEISLVHATLLAMAYLLAKHTVADFLLQNDFIVSQKGRYGAPGGIVHALEHVLLTAPVFWLFPSGSGSTAFMLLATEFLLHYHIDWAKDQIVHRYGLTASQRSYWAAHGVDQLLHGLTYIGILWVWFDPA